VVRHLSVFRYTHKHSSQKLLGLLDRTAYIFATEISLIGDLNLIRAKNCRRYLDVPYTDSDGKYLDRNTLSNVYTCSRTIIKVNSFKAAPHIRCLPPSSEDGNRFSVRNIVFSSV
jgi:hypothetical protein